MLNIALITLGMLTGLVFALSVKVRNRARPVTDLLVALRPLLIVVLVLLAAATTNQPKGIQLVTAFVLVLLVWRLIVHPESTRSTKELGMWVNAIENGARNAFGKLGLIAIPVFAAGAALTQLLHLVGLLQAVGGIPAVFLVIAIVALGSAVMARLFAYATTLPRAAVSILLGLAIVAGLMHVGVLWREGFPGEAVVALACAFGVALLLTVLYEMKVPFKPKAAFTQTIDHRLGAGLGLAMLAGIALVAATGSSLVELAFPRHTELAEDPGARTRLYLLDDRTPEYRHAPVLAFTRDQSWTPESVDNYVRHGKVLRRDRTLVKHGPYSCPSIGPRSCLRRSCAKDVCGTPRGPHDKGEPVNDGALYVRTVRRPKPGDGSDKAVALRALFRVNTPTARKTRALLQYWLFYPYDEWKTAFLGAQLTQRHEGDWESVSVGLGRQDAPLFVAYSAHCGGTWKPWKDAKHFDASHPLVAVARGSQASYADAGANRPPDWTSCTHLPRGVGALLSYAANVRDVTSDDWQWGAEKVLRVDEKQEPMNFPGTWGDDDVTEIKTGRRFVFPPGGGPQSPPLQALWQEPMRTIFCDRYWDGPEDC